MCNKHTPNIIKQMITVTVDGEIYTPLPSSPVSANIFPFFVDTFKPESPSAFLSVNLTLLFGLVLAKAIYFANSFLLAISSASVPIVQSIFLFYY